MFGVPASSALSYAIVVHGVMFMPVLALAILFASYEGIHIYRPDVGATEELEPPSRPPQTGIDKDFGQDLTDSDPRITSQ
jgi:hypothetical protein